MYVVGSFSRHGNQIWVDVLVEHRAIGQHSSLRVDAFDGALRSYLRNLLLTVRSTEIQGPDWQRACFLQMIYELYAVKPTTQVGNKLTLLLYSI